jgi:phosphate transport system substrate-binding protein
MTHFNRLTIFLRILLLLMIVIPSGLAQTLRGAGSTFPYTLYTKWIENYRKLHPGVKIHYLPTGSSVGIEHLLDGKAEFAATDTPLTEAQRAAIKNKFGSDVLEIPSMLGAVVPIYKVKEVNSELKFTAAALAGIYLGTIRTWDDPEIANANPSVSLPNDKIIVVHRSDTSDTTYHWTDFLSRVSPEWKSGPGTGLNVKWPIGLAAKGDDGVEDIVVGPTGNYGIVDLVSNVPNSIGYVQLHYALENSLPYGDVQSATGGFVRATKTSLATAAAEGLPENFRGSIENERGPGTYPISFFTWIVVPAKMHDQADAQAMADFLKWILTNGQTSAEALYYAKLPQPVVEKAMEEIQKLR